MDRGTWRAMIHSVAKNQRRLKQFSTAHTEYLKVKVSQSCPTLMQPHGLYSPWNCQGQNTGVGNLSLLQGIFPIQGSNSSLPHCGQILYQLSHKGSPRILERVPYPFSSRSSRPRNPTRGLLRCRRILHQLSYQGSPTEYLVESESGNEMCF